ncbi:MAG: Nudix family hydrolase [Pseudomonadota bacterium]
MAVGVILAPDRQRILISRRAARAHQGGLWEFPGGKVEPGETVVQALRRELHEELDLQLHEANPLRCIEHDYGDRRVRLDVWTVDDWSGTPTGMENQPLRWVEAARLDPDEFPVANRPIIRCLRLSDVLAITPVATDPEQAMVALLDRIGRHGGLIQLRQPSLDNAGRDHLLRAAAELPDAVRNRLILNTRPEDPALSRFGGCHLTARRLRECRGRPVREDQLLGASCHTREELELAESMGADYATLSPVRETASHPEAEPLGWARFRKRIHGLHLPVYALGGMTMNDIATAAQYGARGVAGMRLLW